MEDRIKTAADNMLNRGDINKEDHDKLYKLAFSLKGMMQATGKGLTVDNLRKGLFTAALLGTGAAATKEILVDPIIEKNKIDKSFKAMTDKVPQLAEADQEKMKDYFSVVKTFSPKAASNPLVAGALVNKMMQFGGVDHKLVQDISAIQAGLPQSKVTPAVFESVAKNVGSAAVPSEKTTAEFDGSMNLKGFSISKD